MSWTLSEPLKDFSVSSAALSRTAKAALNQVAAQIEARAPGRTVTCTGWTDGTGSAAYDQALSRRRAVAVCDYLANQGLSHRLLHSVGKGKGLAIRASPRLRRVVITVRQHR